MSIPDRKLSVLLVDDDAGSLSRFHELLSGGGVEIELECVTTHISALAAFRRNKHDIAIIDSPRGNALTLLSEARSVGCHFPILIVVAESADEVLRAMHIGAADCLIRNHFSTSLLEQTICGAVERAALEEWHLENERRYLSLIQNASDIVYTHDLDGNYTSVNNAVTALTGYTREEALRLNLRQVVAPEYFVQANEMLSRKMAEQQQTSYEIEIVTKDGGRVPIDVSTHLIYKNGRPVAVQGIARNITRRREAELASRENEQRFRDLFENANDIIYTHDLKGKFTSLNRVGERVTGYSREEAMAMNISDVVAPEDLTKVYSRIAQKAGTDDYTLYQLDIISKDGRRISLEVNTKLIAKAGQPPFIQGIARDITERKKTQQEIEEANRRALADYDRLVERIATLGQTLGHARELNTIFRALRDFAVVSLPCDGMGISLYKDEEATRKLVYCWADGQEFDPAEIDELPVGDGMTGRSLKNGTIVVENDMQAYPSSRYVSVGQLDKDSTPRSAISAPMSVMGRVVGCIEIQSYRADAYTPDHMTAIRMAANLAANAVENVDLIERERQKAEQLRQAQKMEAVGQLAGGVAHDFNNLLTAITGYSDISLRTLPTESPVRRNLEEIKRAGTRAASLTRQLLAFSRKQMLQPKVLELNSIVADMDKMLRRVIGEDIDLVTILDPLGCFVKADPSQIEQVILNLAVNARDAMPKGGKLTIETRHLWFNDRSAANHVLTAGEYIMLAVSDNGLGMDEDTERRVFEPFFTTKEIGKGTGLGLSTVYGIVKQSGGSVWVYSEPAQGSTFKIYLPLVSEGASHAEGKPEISEAPQGRETILLVEDEEMVRNLSREVLEGCGYTVLTAANGLEACDTCRTFSGDIQLLITDVVMPQMGGRQLAEAVAEIRPEMSVLYMSGYTDDAVVRHGVLDDEMPFLQKPFSPDALAQKVKEVLDNAATPIAA